MPESDLLSSLITELRRGALTLAVLSQLGGAQYGYSLLQRLEEKSTRIEAGTLYPLLRRLEAQGLLESRWDTAESRPRKYYIRSAYGQEIYEALKIEWRRLSAETDALLEEDSL